MVQHHGPRDVEHVGDAALTRRDQAHSEVSKERTMCRQAVMRPAGHSAHPLPPPIVNPP
jgi:hypothetical protein